MMLTEYYMESTKIEYRVSENACMELESHISAPMLLSSDPMSFQTPGLMKARQEEVLEKNLTIWTVDFVTLQYCSMGIP